VLLFSATLDGPVAKLVADFQHNPVRHEVGPKGPDVHAAKHHFWLVDREERVATTADVIQRLGSTIVFTRTRHGADRLGQDPRLRAPARRRPHRCPPEATRRSRARPDP
jgi:superfamily II DNA/RNA helicase